MAVALAFVAAGCTGKLPKGAESFTVGKTTVRVDSALDLAGIEWRVADSADVPARGPAREWLTVLRPHLADSVFAKAQEVGVAPISLLLETWAAPDRTDSVCGLLGPGDRRCFTGDEPVKTKMKAFLGSVHPFPVQLDATSADDRHTDLQDVYVSLTAGKSLDSTVIAYSGFANLEFNVTLARTLPTGLYAPAMDPAAPRPPAFTIFLSPDDAFPVRSYRSPNYIWLALGHQMVHAAVRRLLAEHPELVDRSIRLKPAIEGEMVRAGYQTTIWDDALAEQIARAVTIRILAAARPTVTWAARADQLNAQMALVPYIEDALRLGYEPNRARYKSLSDFAPELVAALDSVPLDSCRAAPFPGVAILGIDRHRGIVGWIAPNSPFRARGLTVGDTVLAINGDSVAGGGLLTPSWQVDIAVSQNLPFELGIIGIRRHGHDYDVQVPIQWVKRPIIRVQSQNPAAARAEEGPTGACRWVRRVVRQ